MRSNEPEAESELIGRSREGDTAAFDQLITLYRDRIYMIAYNIVRNEHDALDVTQESFVRAWRSLRRFDGGASFGSWVSRIATNAAIDVVRRRRAHPQADIETFPMNVDAASKTTPSAAEHPSAGLERVEIKARIEAAFAKLSPEHRAVIILKEVEDLSYKEIADAIGCSIGTVMSRLFYARKHLQSELRTFYEEL